mgnify:CR=1 FL=1
MNLNTVKEKIIRVKDKEKDGFVKYLGDMSVEQREVANLFKKHGLGIWSKGNMMQTHMMKNVNRL